MSTYRCLHIYRLVSSRTVSLERSAYERLRAAKRPGESFTVLVNRLLEGSQPSFRSLAGVLSKEDARAVREAIKRMRKAEGRSESERLALRGVYDGRDPR